MSREQMIRMRLVQVVDICLARYESKLLPEASKRAAGGSSDASELGELIDALLRLDSGRFGLCEECGEAISYERLVESPTTGFCAGCAGHETWRPSPTPA